MQLFPSWSVPQFACARRPGTARLPWSLRGYLCEPLPVARMQVRQFYTAPTLIRALEAQDDKHVTKHDRGSLRVLGTVGEPINPRAWAWFFQVGDTLVRTMVG